MTRYFILLLVVLLVACSKQPLPKKIIDLNKNWLFKNANDSVWLPATVPGTVHTDLLTNQLIQDPFYRNNELDLQWIEQENWDYTTTFSIDRKTLKHENLQLTFEGLDTYAEILLNDSSILMCNNMFRKWDVDVKNLLRIGENILRINFTSPINYNREKAGSYPYSFPADNDLSNPKVSPFTRKAAYHFGWDWAPRLIPLGIWQEVSLKCWDDAKIEQIQIHTLNLDKNQAEIEVELVFNCTQELELEIALFGQKQKFKINSGNNTISIPHLISEPNLWWPNGSGTSHLYRYKVEVFSEGKKIDDRQISFGLRDIELINGKDSIGTSFYFKVNGEAIFIKGANYVPQDVFLPRVKPQQYRELLIAAKEANMNMIRVWGGGVYECDLFYELCDSLGLLVWQDFMFAGTMYPADQEFIDNVESEITYQIKRLSNHPCLALWCGNNEIEVAWKNWGWQEKYNYSTVDSSILWQNYEWLFKEKIPSIVNEYSPSIPYVSTSPISNWGTEENFNHSTMHYWGVWHGKENFDAFENNVGRFMVEYGFQSYPSIKTIEKFSIPQDWNLQSPVMINRQKSYIGNGEILKQIENNFQPPNNFVAFIKLSQKTQALALSKAIKSHREKEGHCKGTLLWQLNDCWPGPSWSIIDYYGSRKEAYYSVQSAFE